MNKLYILHNFLKKNSFYKEASEISELINGEESEETPESFYADDKELLELLINDQINILESPQREEMESWGGIMPLLERIGADITQLKRMGEPTNFYKISIPNEKTYIIDSEYPEFKGNDLKSWVQDMIDSNRADEWVGEVRVDHPSLVYHGTREENLSDILENGLECRSDSRGLTNRSVGCAIFTSSEESETEDYGDVLLEIDLDAMGRDGVLPRISLEPPIEEYEMYSSFASMFGLNLGDDVHYDIEYGKSMEQEFTDGLLNNIETICLNCIKEMKKLQNIKNKKGNNKNNYYLIIIIIYILLLILKLYLYLIIYTYFISKLRKWSLIIMKKIYP
jgi:hypothetical protein